QQVLSRVVGLPCEMRGLDAVRRHPAVQLRVEVFAFACAHNESGRPGGLRGTAGCVSPKRGASSRTGHAQGRAAADRRQLLCTTNCADFFEVTPIRCCSKEKPAAFATGYCLPTRGLRCASLAGTPIVMG